MTGAVEHRYYVHSSERAIAVVTPRAGQPKREHYLHVDQLGSVEVLSDEAGAVVERRSYDAFGARRHPRWDWPSPPSFVSQAKRGFTGHEGDDELGLVNMKGRIYSPKVGRFLTPDPVVSRPQFSQSWNTYSYVLNNPLAYVDPSGFQDAPPVPEGADQQAAAAGQPIEVWVIGPPPPRRERDEEAIEPGVAITPSDLDIQGNAASSTVAPAPDEAGHGMLTLVGEFALGAGEGVGELALSVARSMVLNAVTFGGYGTYDLGRAMWDGYKEAGILGALNALNPLYQVGRGGVDTTLAVQRGDYRAAGAVGATTAILAAATAVGAGRAAGALPGETAAATGAARGGAFTGSLLKNATQPFKGGNLTQVGRARTKHPEVPWVHERHVTDRFTGRR